ncbi:slit homolog 1 protein-like [Daktulosphaira vitifoliae]|uniref:slit homolog 1 protein-like n=1 Tax=Daktulosphaira vitifoliae TaxID=58002 RepID=UPI0021AAE31A|nr:slit homolog 1 protein-like [Daktulosphaira vitifoliae]
MLLNKKKFHKIYYLLCILNVSFTDSEKDFKKIGNIRWDTACPRACSCGLTPFIELPISKWIHFGLGPEEKSFSTIMDNDSNNKVINEKKYVPFTPESFHSLKTTLCIFINVTKPKEFLHSLPNDTEALILYQSIDSRIITLTGNEWQLPALIVMDIHGVKNKLHITDEIFETLKSMRYLSLENVSLDKLILDSNQPKPSMNSKMYKNENLYAYNELVPLLSVEKSQIDIENSSIIKNTLIFLQPKDAEILPYRMYKKQQQTEGKTNKKIHNSFTVKNNISFLRIVNCGLHNISWDLFDGFHSLETLILDHNGIEFIPDFTFYGAKSLKSLSLADNKINHMQTTGLGGLLDLKYLNLKNNELTYLSETTFPPLPRLQIADLKGNPVITVFPHTFEVLNSTKELTLGSSEVQLNLASNSFIGLDSLEKLCLNNININTFERPLLGGLINLVELKIEGIIKHIAFDAFVEVPNIKHLVLRNCSIKSISMDSFYGLYKLEHLDLSYNQIEELPPGLFDQQFSLKEIIMNNNKLTNIPDGVFKTMSRINIISLDNNPLHCSCYMKSWDTSLMAKKIQQVNKRVCKWDRNEKGYSCSFKKIKTYVYSKKSEPICFSPEKFKGKTVSHVLRKYLNCDKKPINKYRSSYMKKKYIEYKEKYYLSPQDTNLDNNNTNKIEQINFVTTNIKKNDAHKEYDHIVESTSKTSTEQNLKNINIFDDKFNKSVQLNNGTFISKEEISKNELKIAPFI